MAVTAGQVITAARDLHQAFTDLRTPDGVLLRQLGHFKRRLWGRITNINSSVLAVTETIPLSTYDFATGHPFPANVYVLPSGEVEPSNELDPSERSKFTLIGMNVRLYSRPLLSGWFVQDQLFLQGSAQDWAGFVNVHLDYVAMPTGPVGLADTFAPAPDSVEATLVTYLANVMAKRGHNDPTLPAIDRQQFQGDHDAAFAQFLMEQGEKRKARRFKTLDVFPGGG